MTANQSADNLSRRRQEAAGPAHCDLLIRNGFVITVGRERTIFKNGAIAIRDGVIAGVGPEVDVIQNFTAARTIDAKGAAVHPGFIEPHVHISLHSARGTFPDAADGSTPFRRWYTACKPEDEYASGLHCALEALRNGYTTIADPGTLFEPDAAAQAATEVGIRSSVADPFLWDRADSAPKMEAAPATSERAMRLLGGQLHRNRGPRSLSRGHIALYGMGTASDELILAAKHAADQAGVAFTMHQSFTGSDTEADDRRYGEHPFVHFAKIGALGKNCSFVHMNMIRDDEMIPIVESGMSVVWHPANFQFYNIASLSRSRMAELRDQGAHITFCTDVAKAWTFADMGLVAYLVAREHGGFIPPEAIFEMQSIGAARAIASEDSLGSIEVGKCADIVIRHQNLGEAQPDFDAIREIALVGRSKSVDTVIVAGQVVLQGGRSLRIDEQNVWRLAKASAQRLVGRLGLTSGPAWPIVVGRSH